MLKLPFAYVVFSASAARFVSGAGVARDRSSVASSVVVVSFVVVERAWPLSLLKPVGEWGDRSFPASRRGSSARAQFSKRRRGVASRLGFENGRYPLEKPTMSPTHSKVRIDPRVVVAERAAGFSCLRCLRERRDLCRRESRCPQDRREALFRGASKERGSAGDFRGGLRTRGFVCDVTGCLG